MPNSEINYIANESQESNRAIVEIAIPYGSDMRGAMEVLHHQLRRDGQDDSGFRNPLRLLRGVMTISVFPAEQTFNREPGRSWPAKASDRRSPIPSSNSGKF